MDIGRPPEPRVLRHRYQETAARPNRGGDAIEDRLILLDVLEHVEQPDGVEPRLGGEVARVGPAQRRRGHALPCPGQRFVMKVGAGQIDVRERTMNPSKDEPGPATDLEKRADRREIPLNGPHDQAIARFEPEMPLLDCREAFERFDRKPARRELLLVHWSKAYSKPRTYTEAHMVRARGVLRVTHGPGHAARVLAWVMRLPEPGD